MLGFNKFFESLNLGDASNVAPPKPDEQVEEPPEVKDAWESPKSIDFGVNLN